MDSKCTYKIGLLLVWSIILGLSFVHATLAQEKPNILWISTEDHNPAIGAYGDELARTPTLDKLASEGILYQNAFVPSPICSPARSAIITGMHATSLGTQNLRSDISIPGFIKTLPELLKEEGYYTTNNSKTDYNFDPSGRWHESSNNAHWRNRASNDQPFFSVFNLGVTHESRVNRDRFGEELFDPLEERHDPDQMEVPPFLPDTPEMRRLLARQYDLISLADLQIKEILDQLEEDGLDENTIIFFWSDHGFGLPRYKRWLYSTGLEAALIVRVPTKYRHLIESPPGTETTQLVSLVDLAPTVLSLTGVETPEYMEGIPFLGEFKKKPRTHFVAHRDRADDVYDMSRAVRTKKYMYIRNYMPYLPYMQQSVIFSDIKWSFAELHRARSEGLLPQSGEAMFRPRPKEELYNVQADPFELNNLADDPDYRFVLEEMRMRLNSWVLETKDTGFLQEAEMMHRSEGTTPYEMANDPSQYNLARIKAAAEMVGDSSIPISVLEGMLDDTDSGVRYWGTVALRERVEEDSWKAIGKLSDVLSDSSPSVQIKAAETLCKLGHCDQSLNVLAKHLQHERDWHVLQAAISIRQIADRTMPIIEQIRQARLRYSGDTGHEFVRDPMEEGYRDFGYALFIGFALDQTLLDLGVGLYPD
ncbi:MAG: sulfatase-like hydrolase/transferase [Bacteroidetes bacterium]|jgi:arylsulfatase A-like enzyme|nr:sulfatase-like hydrolase/transferase [Bacteroidota bacterium]